MAAISQSIEPSFQKYLNGLAVFGQLLLGAFLAAGSDSPGELVGLGGILVGGQNFGVLTSFDL